MQIHRITTDHEFQRFGADWNRIADNPFRRHEWLATWWRHYGRGFELYTLCVEEAGELIAAAPFYRQSSVARGRILRLLGDGEVCSDYVGILGRPQHAPRAAAAIADHLFAAANARDDGWDSLRLEGVDAHDNLTACFADALKHRGCLVRRHAGPNSWRLELPGEWAAYEAALSKSHRKQVRRLINHAFTSQRATLHTVTNAIELEQGRQILIDLHQRRRRALGEPGCFSSPAFAAFHNEAMRQLLAAGLLRLHWLQWDGVPASAEYQLAAGNVIYAYQSGLAPELLDEEPGRLSTIATMRLAVEQGYTALDFLRGDEPYKAHFRAQPRPLVEYRIAAPRAAARIRHTAWNVRDQVKDWWRGCRQESKLVTAAAQTIVKVQNPEPDL